MKKIVMLICVVLIFTEVLSAQSYDKSSEEKSYIETIGKPLKRPFNINPFTFSAFFVENLVPRFKLDQILTEDEILTYAEKTYENMRFGMQTKIHIPNYQDEIELFIIINPVENNKYHRIEFVLIANINPKTNKLIDSKDVQGDFWGKFYTFVDGELVGTKRFLLSEPQTQFESKTDEANYYLFDADSENDQQIEELLRADIQDKDYKFRAFSIIVLAQFYMKTGNTSEAERVLNSMDKEIEEYKINWPKSNIDFFRKLAFLENEIVKTIR